MDLPVLSIAKLHHHTGTLLGILIGRTQRFRIQVVAQMDVKGEILISIFA